MQITLFLNNTYSIANLCCKYNDTLYDSLNCPFFATIYISKYEEVKNMEEIKIGYMVKSSYNSGTYIGEVMEDKQNFLLVKVLAVVTHPTQGDLHQRGQVEGVAFHERKALAHQEKFNARKRMTEPYNGDVPNYASSLKQSVDDIKSILKQEDTAFNTLSLARIADLETHFYHKIYL